MAPFAYFVLGIYTLINVCESARVMKPQVCARCFWTMDRKFKIDEMKLLNKKLHVRLYQAVWLIAGQWSSTQWRSARTTANINKVKDLALGQEYKPQKQFTWKTAWRISIFHVQSSQWPIYVF